MTIAPGTDSSPSRVRPSTVTESAGQASRAPVIVLAPAYSGAPALRSLLENYPELACTSGTGLLALCEQSLATWSKADRRRPDGPPSALATASTRALASSVVTAILAREGKTRWCEIAAANTQAAGTFLSLYPGTRFLCLYRNCPDFIRSALNASPWGLTDPAFTPFTMKYPASPVAALTAHWVAITAPLADFEREHPRACLRVRFGDDLALGGQTEERIMSFLDLTGAASRLLPESNDPQPQLTSLGPMAEPPPRLIPPPLLAQTNDLLRQLDYPAMPGTGVTGTQDKRSEELRHE
jgi:hypothetical protein